MKLEEFDLGKLLEFRPTEGKLLLQQDRMLLFRQDAMASLRRLLYEQVGERLARSLLMQFGYRCGFGDFGSLNRAYTWETEDERLGIGPVMHTWEGIVQVAPEFLKFDRATGAFHARGLWKNSYEAEVHVREFGVSAEPTCFSLTGYGSGWCSAFFGKPVLEIETRCVGRGDAVCEWEIKPIDEWGPEASPWRDALSSTGVSIAKELEEKLRTIDEQQRALEQLSTPVIEVWEGVLVVPVLGMLDRNRANDLAEKLTREIMRTQSRYAILDLTGVETVDTSTAEHLIRILRSVELMGGHGLLCGIRPAVAQTVVTLGLDMGQVTTAANLRQALKRCIAMEQASHVATGGRGRVTTR